ncbi:MAG TPA: ATP-binding protein, partial [Candidatus Nitrosotenuis sp.]|nr:ATP-binding protein [Candidatus Nitrosotenuis sp.]
YRDERMPQAESLRTTESLLGFLISHLEAMDSADASAEVERLREDLIRFEEGIAARRVRFQIEFEDLLQGLQFLRQEIWAELRRHLTDITVPELYELERRLNEMLDQMIVGMTVAYISSQAEVIASHERALVKWEEVVKSASQIRLKIPCREEFAAIVRLQAEAIARRVNYTEEEIYDIITAVGEVCDNAIEHGKSERGIDVQYLLTMEEFTVEVIDYGPGFDPAGLGQEPPDPLAEGGRGLFLTRHLMDRVEIDSRPGQTRVLMAKKRYFRDGPR